ncbi:MAG: response regulator transcription factor [Patescibacteria group bacterium]
MRILLIEDQVHMALTIKETLEKSYIVEVAYTGEDGLSLAQNNMYDLIILDYIMPDINGLFICKHLRKNEVKAPILMLTAQLDIQKKVIALDAGADDYLTKPFSFDELQARIRALLRRKNTESGSNILTVGNLIFDLNKKVIKRDGQKISLRRKEQYLLEYLMRNAGYTITREMIFDHVWDSANESFSNIVDVHIKYLRDQIDKPFDKKMIKTVHGFGYKIEA